MHELRLSTMKKIVYSFLLLQVFFLTKAIAQPIIVFKGDNVVIGQNVSILEDSTENLDFNTVRNSTGFKLSENEVPNLKLSNSAFWLRFTIKNETRNRQLLLSLDYPTLDQCVFYYPEDGKFKTISVSDNNNFDQRKYKHQDFIFDIYLSQDSTATFYLKVKSNEQMVLPLVLGTAQQIAESKFTRDLLWGVLIGILSVMVMYNSFVYISTKDISYLYYVLYTLFIALTQTSLSGYTYRLIFPNSPMIFTMGTIIFNALGGIAFSLFAQSFLGIKEKMPKMAYVFKFIIFLYSLTIIVRLLGYPLESYRMTDMCALVVTVSTYIVVIKLSMNGYRPAKFFLLAWSMFFIGVVLFVLRNLGVLPYNSYTNNTMPIGVAFEVILLSLALADRINIFKAEKEKSQEETLRALKENEKIVREQNVMLELKVTERTIELSKANEELNITLENLKQTQTQLVESEKMASLGQLTAGIAHEINKPINFVTSNINPLKRDIELVLEALTTIEGVGLSEIPVSDKIKQIEAYKEELDFDYLTSEIKHLINGINEGATRTAEIVKGLRFFSRLDEDGLKTADVNEGIISTLVIAKNLLNNKIKVNKDFGELPAIECYPGKLNQAFLNIISNAAYAVQKQHENDLDGEISIETKHDEESVFIKIRDNGTGMDENTMRKLFEPFFTTKDVGEGTGLGMSIAYNIVKKHNGTINVSSIVGEGTEFILQLPIRHIEG